MKRKYEGVIILDTTGHEDKVDDLVQRIGKEIEDEGCQLEQIEQIGRREFAYNAQHLAAGHYVAYQFEAEPADLEKLETRLKLNSVVHLQQYMRL